MHRFALATALWLAAAGCRQARHPDPRLTLEEPQPLQSSIDATNPADELQLLDGFYAPESGGWRWSAPQFTVSLGVPEELRGKDARIEFEFTIPEVAARDLEGLVIQASVDHHELPAWRSPGAGTHTAAFSVPAALLQEDGILVDFTLDRFIPPRGGETRQLGVIPMKFRLVPARVQ